MLSFLFHKENENPPTCETPCNIGDEIVNGTLPAGNQCCSLQPFCYSPKENANIQGDEYWQPVCQLIAQLFQETEENQEYQYREKKKVHQFIRLEKIKVRRNVRDQGSRDTSQHKDDGNPQDSWKVMMKKIFQKTGLLKNRDHPPIRVE